MAEDEVAVINEEGEEIIRTLAWADEAANKPTYTINEVEQGVDVVIVGSDGKTMTSHNVIETLPSISNLTGRCWRKLISLAYRN